MSDVKICGLKTPDTIEAAIDAGARFIGFVFYPKSPRYISPKDAANLVGNVPESVSIVGLFVDPTDDEITKALQETPLDMLQLHGTEAPERLREIRHKFSLPIIKALPIATKADLDPIADYIPHADWLLFDAKPQNDAPPGGNGEVFDWSILKNFEFEKPWMLSGGLNAKNVKQAITLLNPRAVDVSSGVESTPGEKDPGKIKTFIQAVKTA